MRILIAEDDLASRRFMDYYMSKYGHCDTAKDGIETIEAFITAFENHVPYDLLCIDVMMPKVDGIKALKTIRELEDVKNVPQERRVKVLLTTALGETDYIVDAMNSKTDIYLNKPINIIEIEKALKQFNLF